MLLVSPVRGSPSVNDDTLHLANQAGLKPTSDEASGTSVRVLCHCSTASLRLVHNSG